MQFGFIKFDGLNKHIIYKISYHWSNLEISLFGTYNMRIKKTVNDLILATGKNDIDTSSTVDDDSDRLSATAGREITLV